MDCRNERRHVAGQKVCARVLALLAGGLLLGGLGSCQRKAPGPDECLAFAKVWMQRHPVATGHSLVAADPFDDLVRDCLTTPYDRALVECVINGKAPQRCRMEFARRTEERREERAR
jgi:hypothetical protein